MNVIVTALKELFGLFVEDGSYAVAIIAWLLIAALVLPHIGASEWRAPLLLAGLLLVMCENVLRSAKQAKR
jgi:hypothetical protein